MLDEITDAQAGRQADQAEFFEQIQKTLHGEIIRKLKLASGADSKEDREIVCSEIFADITGELDEKAKACLWMPDLIYYYELLSSFYNENSNEADSLLRLCRTMWGQSYIAPIYTLLLHRWMLLQGEAGGRTERLKHIHVLAQGARGLFWGDVHSGKKLFAPLYRFIYAMTVLDPQRACLLRQPADANELLLALVASFSPFYSENATVMNDLMGSFPVQNSGQETAMQQGDYLADPCRSANFLMGCILSTLKKLHSEPALLVYLQSLQALKSNPYLDSLDEPLRARLQAELYALRKRGGPRYLPLSVRKEASTALDSLFPHGALIRRLIGLVFILLHPADWPVLAWIVHVAALCFRIIVSWTRYMVQPCMTRLRSGSGKRAK